MQRCNICGAEFFGGDSMVLQRRLQDHIRANHTNKRLEEYKIPQSTINDIPKQVNADKPKIEGQIKIEKPEPPPAPIPPPPVEIKLTYKYTGQCPECRIEVDTMEFTVAGQLFMVAWCPRCKMKRKEMEVMPIGTSSYGEPTPGSFPINKFKKKK